MNDFHILALSGGGFKGLYTAKVLAKIEEEFGCPVAQKFDLIAGTSIGGILGIAVSLEIPASEMVKLFVDHGKTIFSSQKRSWIGMCKSKYSNKGLHEVLQGIFGDKTVGDLKHRVIIPTINFTKGGPQVIKTRHHESFRMDHSKKLVDVALMTSAAPTFFPIHRTDYGDFIDGGLTANHPGLFACIEAQKFLDVKLEDIYQLHIGTLSGKYTSSGKTGVLKSGLLQWKTKLIELIFSCQEQSTDQIVKFMLEANYYSIDETPSDDQASSIGLDKVDEVAQRILKQCAEVSAQSFIGKPEFNRLKNHSKHQFIPIPFEKENTK
ncbi:CBASS cGAMP-activated phospholipase [Alkalispirochaeta alkalica]|uniref:CBASS cGAMP-activated phospholipase n=1 Tax=Alkalispirochaeta alkalica TaxID=46356 RepID=UPI0009FD90F6|nr:CBASS cGAMP-activated phospholipase [Alkalispirochaeta alkalica]